MQQILRCLNGSEKPMNTNGSVIEKLAGSKIYQDYERAFCEATGQPLALRPVESWQLVHHGRRRENPFCSLMSQKSRSCAACLQTQQKLADSARQEAHSVTCAHGLCDTAVPVQLGGKLLGFLQTGQVFRRKPTEAQFERSARLPAEWGLPAARSELRETYFATKVVPAKQHESVVNLLKIFAQHLALVSNQVIVQQQNSELPVVTRAKEYIQQNQAEPLSLTTVAK